MDSPRKVFLSYRSVDRDRVREVAAQLRNHGVDAWLDMWEIQPGDNFVAKINEGLDQCDCGVIFLSNGSAAGAWHQEEITILKTLFVDEKRPLIPVLLDAGVKVPPILRPHSRLTATQIPELIDAIYRRTTKPDLGPPILTPTRTQFRIQLRSLDDGAIGVQAQIDGQSIAPETTRQPGPAFHFSYRDFLQGAPGSRMAPANTAANRLRDLQKFGEAVGQVVFPPEIDAALESCLDGAASSHTEIELIYEALSPELLGIPFEAARLAGGRVPSLVPAVYTWRRLAPAAQSTAPPRHAAPPGPLKILVAVGAPDEEKTNSAVLNSERELQTILDAIEPARRLENAFVRVLEVGSLPQIAAALRERSYHVLHLSGHGNQGILQLEDEDGEPVPTGADEIAAAIHESGHPAPLVFLAACHSGRGASDTAGFAQNLIAAGVPAVVAMQTAVSDWYATELAGKFYEALAGAETPLPSRALALARRQLEQARLKATHTRPDNPALVPEYATASLFLRDTDHPVLNRALPQIPVEQPPPPAVSGAVPLLKIGELIGRRREMRRLIRVLTDDPRALAATGRQAGCQILGTGGVGKSAIAGRIMQRMADRGWRIAAISGPWNLANLASAVGAALWGHPEKSVASLARQLNDPEAPDALRLEWLKTALSNHNLLLVLDNFEDVLNPPPAAPEFRDAVTAGIFATLAGSARQGKLLITSRYPVPDSDAWLYRQDLGPLSRAETRKLMLRHEGLLRQPSESVKLIERAIGGHPRTLEYLDALLRNGVAQLDTVQHRLIQFATRADISLDAPRELEDSVRDAIRVAAADAMVEELVRLVSADAAALHLLWQASVFPFPVPVDAPVFGDDGGAMIGRLAATSLLTRLDNGQVFVHRWTAESLKPGIPLEQYRSCCIAAAEYLAKRPVADAGQYMADLTESIRLFLSAAEFDRAAQLGSHLILRLKPYGQTTVWTDLAREIGSALPDEHPEKLRFIGTEGQGLESLSFSDQAMERYARAAAIAERLVQQEPDRADFLRDLSVSYNKMGDLHAPSARASPRASSIRSLSTCASGSSSRNPIVPISKSTS